MLRRVLRDKDLGLLILRLGVGILFVFHGAPKLFGGLSTWEKLGTSMSHIGIEFYPIIWGFMAALTEFVGGILLGLGLWVKKVSMLLTITMIIASISLIAKDSGFVAYSHPLKMIFVFASLVFMGGGKYSLDTKYYS